MKGFRLIKIESLADLEKAKLAFWITDLGYHLKDLKGSYTDATGTETEFEQTEQVTISFAGSVHNRVFVETAKAWKAKDGNLYMTAEELERHF